MSTYLSKIPKDQWTLFERKYNEKRPYHFYRIRNEWNESERDFMAYWNGKLQDLLDKFEHPSARPVREISAWLDPIWRNGSDPKAGTTRQWQEYHDAQAVLWDSLSQDEQDEIRGTTEERKKNREAFESMTPEERSEHEKATRASGGGYWSTRNHVDGRVLNEMGEIVGRWKEPDGSILDKVIAWSKEVHHGKKHVRRWQEAANGIKPGTFPGVATMSSAKASEYASRFRRSRWEPAARAIRDREIGFTDKPKAVDVELEETLKVINERPDVEVRKYNPETNTLDVLSPATMAQSVDRKEFVAPEHKQQFIEYLKRERDFLLVELGAGHPQNKGKVLDHFIATVEADERMHSQEQYTYNEFREWLDGKRNQRLADGTVLYADGEIVDLTGYKVKQDAYANKVKQFQKARDAGDPEAQDGFDHWTERDSPERRAIREQLAQQKALREVTPGDNKALAKRTEKILTKFAKDKPTPREIAAAVAAGDWHKVAQLAEKQSKSQRPPDGYVWFGWIRQGTVASGQYICIGDGVYEDAILYLASDFGGRESRPRLYQQNALNGPCTVKHSYDWNGCLREGPFLKTWEEIRAEYDNI